MTSLAKVSAIAVGLLVTLLGFCIITNDSSDEVVSEPEVISTPEDEFVNIKIDEKERMCLAKAIYFEARNQSEQGKIGVAAVVMNRVKVGAYPNTICQVVETGCQFSWNCDKKKKYDPSSHANKLERNAWEEAKELAKEVIIEYNYDRFTDPTKGATYFHAHYVKPLWRKSKELERTVKIDDHIFYRVKG